MITSKAFLLSKLLNDLSLSNQLVAKIIFFLQGAKLVLSSTRHPSWSDDTGFCGNLNLLVIMIEYVVPCQVQSLLDQSEAQRYFTY